ncbi:MAG: FadR family transcriptional regulator [Desulfobacteraceae bacterium]|nr:FadR family transcriptional regulator [Desulfobacteraceae bacterium]MBU4002917.1 GntR family transcriptional regulator [Pseudomonadota bacterium]MBU4053888.1 GntR family transcriptional regulator [Pseudomonadota bacterium]
MSNIISLKIESLKKISLVGQMVVQLRKEILSNVYLPEGPFPSEKDLTLRFGTSRHTVRSALQALAKEGLIEISHGRGNIVKDFRLTVGIDVFPEMVVAYPELITEDMFSIYRQHLMWLYNRIILTAAKKAGPGHETDLIRIIDLYNDKMSVEDYWENHARFFRELLRIGNNMLLMMYYNSHLKMRQKLLETGLLKEIPAVPSFGNSDRTRLVKAICSNNTDAVKKIMPAMEEVLSNSLTEMLSKKEGIS